MSERITWSISAAAAELRCSREAIRAGLVAANIQTKPGYFTAEIFVALSGGDIRHERLRIARAMAHKLETANTVKSGQLLDSEQVGQAVSMAVIELFAELDLALLRDLPQRLAGLESKAIFFILQDAVNASHDACRNRLSSLAGEKVEPFTRRPFVESQAVAENYQRAFQEHMSADWMQFVAWRDARDAESAAGRRAWCVKRAQENMPVPDATDQELQEVEGLRRV